MKDFDEVREAREKADRSFKIGGETFVHRPTVAPEVLLGWSSFAEGISAGSNTEAKLIETIDETVQAILEPEYRETWTKVRDPELPHPLGLDDLRSLLEWLIEQVTGRPTGPPSASSEKAAGRKTGSTANSSQKVSPAEPALST